MFCPKCDTKVKVKDVREDNDGPVRRYKCPQCNLELCTEEVEISKYEFNERRKEAMNCRLRRIAERVKGEKHEV